MSEWSGYERLYRRVLGIGLLVSLAVHGAILAWGQLNLPASSTGDETRAETRLALAYVDDEPVELLDVRVTEADQVTETAPAPESETSTVEASLDVEPPKLAMATDGSMIAISFVETADADVGSAIEYDRLGAAVAAANRGKSSNEGNWERVVGTRIPEGRGRGPLIIGGGGGCKGPSVRLPGRLIGGSFTGNGVDLRGVGDN